MPVTVRPFDAADYLDTPDAVRLFLVDAFESEDAGQIAEALGVVARAKGMTQFAKQAGLSRTALYRALSSNGKPELPTLIKVMKAIGFRLLPHPVASAA